MGPSYTMCGALHPTASPLRSNLGRARTKSLLVTTVRPKFTPNGPFPFDDHHRHLSLDRSHSPPQTASRSNQPFCQNTLSGQTDRQTDTWDKRQVYSKSRLRCTDRERRANNIAHVRRPRLVSVGQVFSPALHCVNESNLHRVCSACDSRRRSLS